MIPAALLDFWFGDLTDGFSDAAHRTRWYAFDDAFVEVLRVQRLL